MTRDLHVPIPAGMDVDALDEALDDIAAGAQAGEPDASRFWADLQRYEHRRKQA